MHQEPIQELSFSPKLLRIPLRPLILPLPRKASWVLSHLVYFPALCIASILSLVYGRPLAFLLRPRVCGSPYICSQDVSKPSSGVAEPQGPSRDGRRQYVEISGYSFVGWGVIAVDDPLVIRHEFSHVEAWLGTYTPGKLAFNLVPLMIAGIFITPLMGLGPLSLALSLTLVLTFSLMAFVKIFH